MLFISFKKYFLFSIFSGIGIAFNNRINFLTTGILKLSFCVVKNIFLCLKLRPVIAQSKNITWFETLIAPVFKLFTFSSPSIFKSYITLVSTVKTGYAIP